MNFDNEKPVFLVVKRGDLEKAVINAIRDTIDAHGDITAERIGSCAKRIVGCLKKHMVEYNDCNRR